MGWATGIHLLPKGPRCSGADALEVAKTSWEGLRDSEVFKGVLGLEDGFDVVLECTGVESCMQMAVMVSSFSPSPLLTFLSSYIPSDFNSDTGADW